MTTVVMEVESVNPEELILILRHLRDQGYPAQVLTLEPLVIAIDLEDIPD